MKHSWLVLGGFVLVAPAFAEPPALDEVVVSSTPIAKSPFELAQSVSVLEGEDLMTNAKPSLGETLSSELGVRSSAFGQASSRPVIRGLDGDRVRILQNGVGVQDASSTSPDHAVPIESLQADRVEVVRGPATLLYGPNAIGGVVNVLDGRIHEELSQQSGAVELRSGTVDALRSGAARLDAPVGSFMIHLDGFYRKSDSYNIPDYARTEELRRAGPSEELGFEPKGTLPQSFAEAEGASLGTSSIFDGGFFGVAGTLYNTTYGLPNGEPNVSIGLQQRRLDLRGRLEEPLPFLSRVETRTGIVSYEHTEYEGDEVGTVFSNDGVDSRIEVSHDGALSGVVGFQYQYSDFSAVGEEAFIPPSTTNVASGFVFEEYVPVTGLTLQAGGRLDGTRVRAPGSEEFPVRENSPTTTSGALGVVYQWAEPYAATLSLTHTERAPSSTELFALGAHKATAAYEIGDENLSNERAFGIDLNLRKRSGWVTGSLGGYYNRFHNFIALSPTGEERDELPVFAFRGVGADFFGAEGRAVVHLFGPVEETVSGSNAEATVRGDGTSQQSGAGLERLDLITQFDFVRAYGRDGEGDLPRIPGWRILTALDYRRQLFGARFEMQHVFRQEQVAAFETEAPSYTLVNLIFTKDFEFECLPVTAFLRLDNLLDDEIRVPTSFVKDIAPLPGRNALAGLRFRF